MKENPDIATIVDMIDCHDRWSSSSMKWKPTLKYYYGTCCKRLMVHCNVSTSMKCKQTWQCYCETSCVEEAYIATLVLISSSMNYKPTWQYYCETCCKKPTWWVHLRRRRVRRRFGWRPPPRPWCRWAEKNSERCRTGCPCRRLKINRNNLFKLKMFTMLHNVISKTVWRVVPSSAWVTNL